MSYIKTTWVDGSTALSAEHMNNIEAGIEAATNESEIDDAVITLYTNMGWEAPNA